MEEQKDKPGNNNSVTQRSISVLVAQAGLDGHDRGAKVIPTSFPDAGMEVIPVCAKRPETPTIEFAEYMKDWVKANRNF